jgi:hypothetical protein
MIFEHGCEKMLIDKLKRKLDHIAEVYGCNVLYDQEHNEDIILSEVDEATGENKWMIVFKDIEGKGLTIHSFGVGFFDHTIIDFPLTAIEKDVVDLGTHFEADGLPELKRTEINLMSDKTIEVIKLIVEKDVNGLHVELIESRDPQDFSVLLSSYFGCKIPEIDDDGFQHFLIEKDGDAWVASTPEIGSWTQETLHNALVIDYSYGEQLLHFTFYNKDAQLVQQCNLFIRSIEKIDKGLVFNSIKKNKTIKLIMDERISIIVTY